MKLKQFLHGPSSTEQLKEQLKVYALMLWIAKPALTGEILKQGEEFGVEFSNLSATLKRLKPVVIKIGQTWELIDIPKSKQALKEKGLDWDSEVRAPQRLVEQPKQELRKLLDQLGTSQMTSVLEEAIGCLEHGFFRAATVLIWQVTISVIYQAIVDKHLEQFNEMKKIKKKIGNYQDLVDAPLKEFDIITYLSTLKLITKVEKKHLEHALTERNHCAHPTDFHPTEASITSLIEKMLKVIPKFL